MVSFYQIDRYSRSLSTQEILEQMISLGGNSVNSALNEEIDGLQAYTPKRTGFSTAIGGLTLPISVDVSPRACRWKIRI